MATAERLYTPELLALAVELAQSPLLANAAYHADARAPTCGSTLALDVALDAEARIAAVGMRARACAIGQAAAAIFARHARGRTAADVAASHDAIAAWLEGQGALPDWPDLALIAAARDYPGRHGALLLPWKAARAALSTAPAEG